MAATHRDSADRIATTLSRLKDQHRVLRTVRHSGGRILRIDLPVGAADSVRSAAGPGERTKPRSSNRGPDACREDFSHEDLSHEHALDLFEQLRQWSMRLDGRDAELDGREADLDSRERDLNRRLRLIRQFAS